MKRTALRTAVAVPLLVGVQLAGAATGLPFRSSFESGNFSEWQGGRDATLTVSSDAASDGRYAARAVMTQGQTTDNYKDFNFGDHPNVGGTAVSDAGLWLQFDAKFDQGFNFGQGPLHKIALINFNDNTGQRRYQILLNVWTSTQRYFVENLRWNADGSFGGSLPGMPQNVGTPAQVRQGQWDRLKLYVRPNTPGRSDGIIRLWVNGVLKTEYTQVAMRENTQFNPNKLILSNYVPTTQTAGVQWWDNFYLGETDPDQASDSPPAAPILRRVE